MIQRVSGVGLVSQLTSLCLPNIYGDNVYLALIDHNSTDNLSKVSLESYVCS